MTGGRFRAAQRLAKRRALAEQLPVEAECDVLRQQIVDRPERRDIRRHTLIDERRRKSKDVVVILPVGTRTVHTGFARVGEDQPGR